MAEPQEGPAAALWDWKAARKAEVAACCPAGTQVSREAEEPQRPGQRGFVFPATGLRFYPVSWGTAAEFRQESWSQFCAVREIGCHLGT